MRNNTEVDFIKVPVFANVPSSQKAWTVQYLGAQGDIDRMGARLAVLVEKERLTTQDILFSWMATRVLPL